jgi:hypothetical protein
MNSRRFSRWNRMRSPPDCAGLQHIDLASVSQRVPQPFCNRAAGCTAHPKSAAGHNRPLGLQPRCPLPPAADMPPQRRWATSCHKPTYAVQQNRDYSITSSARASSVADTSKPSAMAVTRLTTSSNLVGCSTGRSAGFVPRRILST